MSKLKKLYYEVLILDRFRFHYCKIRYHLKKRQMRFLDDTTSAVGPRAVSHNISSFAYDAVFGMAKRMSLLLYPVTALLRGRDRPKVLIVGPRTEDDIFWARALGLHDTTGLDLFTYSKFIELGDIHKTRFADNTFDAVILGWCLAYSLTPQLMIDEAKRITKHNGFLGVGIAVYTAEIAIQVEPVRENMTNSADDLRALVKEDMVFMSDPQTKNDAYECAAVFKIKKCKEAGDSGLDVERDLR